MRSRKSTATLTLVLIGAAALHGCGGDNPQSAKRDVYRNQADCARDWGDDASKCERQSSGRHSGYYYGPSYGHGTSTTGIGSDSTARSGSRAMSSTTVSRGGFGASASSHSSGG